MSKSDLIFSKDHPALVGHFPGNPIVPGVLILEEVFDIFAQDNPGVNLTGFSSAKFLQPLLPEQSISVDFKPTDATRVRFVCSNGKAVFVKGELKLSQQHRVDY
jgi:3-hydroxymyristoyl/3-hydroxydecanoyl-(acyl carrier protein) dehydratase